MERRQRKVGVMSSLEHGYSDMTLKRLLTIIATAGHTTLVLDEVAVSYEIQDMFGISLNDRVEIRKLKEDE